MNKVLTSFNTLFLILLFLSLIFSIFSIPTLNVSETETIRVNFYELIQDENSSKKNISRESKKNNKFISASKNTETFESDNPSEIKKFKINKSDIRNEISKIKLSREKETILKISALIFPAYPIYFISNGFFMALKKASYAMNLNIIRNVLLPIPTIFFANFIGGSYKSFFWSYCLFNWIFVILLLTFVSIYIKKNLHS